MLEKLAEARMRQARVMERFTLARTRVLRAEKRFQAIRQRSTAEEQAASEEKAPAVPSLPDTHQDPAPGENALIAAILAITQTEPASLSADDPSEEETVHLAERKPRQAQHPANEPDAHPSVRPAAEGADTTDRLPVVRQQHSSEPD